MLRTILLAALCCSCTYAFCNSEELSELEKCYSDFVGYYGFTFNGKLPAYWDFHEARGAVLQKGQQSVQPKVCEVAETLYNCTSTIAGFEPICLWAFGVNTTDAQDYYTDRAVGGFQCGAGYNTLMHDWFCMGSVRENKQTILNKCTDDMDKTIKNGGDICGAQNTWLMCQSKIYSSSCDYNAGVFICGSNRAGIDANTQYCENKGTLMQCPPFQ